MYIRCNPSPFILHKQQICIKQIIFGLISEELKSFVQFCPIDFVGNNIFRRNSFECMVLRKLCSLLEKSPICIHLNMSTSVEKFYNLDFLSTSTIWSTGDDFEYEFILENFYNLWAKSITHLSNSLTLEKQKSSHLVETILDHCCISSFCSKNKFATSQDSRTVCYVRPTLFTVR